MKRVSPRKSAVRSGKVMLKTGQSADVPAGGSTLFMVQWYNNGGQPILSDDCIVAVKPATLGTATITRDGVDGVFTGGVTPGSASITSMSNGVNAAPLAIRVVAQPTVPPREARVVLTGPPCAAIIDAELAADAPVGRKILDVARAAASRIFRPQVTSSTKI